MKNKKLILVTVAILAIALFAYFYYFSIDRKKAVEIITKNGLQQGYEAGFTDSFSDDFLISWAKAIRLLLPSFTVNKISYSTSNGIAK